MFEFVARGMLSLAVQEHLRVKMWNALEPFAPLRGAQMVIVEKQKKLVQTAAAMPQSARTVVLQAEQVVFEWQQALPMAEPFE